MSSKIYFKLEVLCTFQPSFDLFPLNQKGEEGLRLHLTANQGMTKAWISLPASLPYPGKWRASLPGGRPSCRESKSTSAGDFRIKRFGQRDDTKNNITRGQQTLGGCFKVFAVSWKGMEGKAAPAEDVFHFSPQLTWQLP